MTSKVGSRELRLLQMLTRTGGLDIRTICERMQMSERTFFRHMATFRELGFIVRRSGTNYSLDPASPFFAELTEGIRFSEQEAVTLRRLLDGVSDLSPEVRHLRSKLASLHDPSFLERHEVDERTARNIKTLYQAVREKRLAVLCQYASPGRGQAADRIVEPYRFLAGNNEVRCYEPASGLCKTFKPARAKEVHLLDLLWSYEDRHRPFYQDAFHCTGEELLPVELRLGRLATSILLEEYPAAAADLEHQAAGTSLLRTRVCSYKGVGRFVLGLFDDIDVLATDGFRHFLSAKAALLTKKMAH